MTRHLFQQLDNQSVTIWLRSLNDFHLFYNGAEEESTAHKYILRRCFCLYHSFRWNDAVCQTVKPHEENRFNVSFVL